MLRKLALKIGFGRVLTYLRAAHAGQYGPEAKALVDGAMQHAAWVGLVLACAIAGLGVYFGSDSQLVMIVTGFATSVLLPAGLIPAAWQQTPEQLRARGWYVFLQNASAEIGLAVVAWWNWSAFGECSKAGGVHVVGLTLPCGVSTFVCAMVAGALTHLGLFSSAKLARPPAKAAQ
jgi:hypothetical protein